VLVIVGMMLRFFRRPAFALEAAVLQAVIGLTMS